MENETLYEVVKKLVGNINPAGDESIDDERFYNLVMLTDLVDKLVTDIDNVAYENGMSQEASVIKSVKHAEHFLSEKLGIKD